MMNKDAAVNYNFKDDFKWNKINIYINIPYFF